MHQAIYTYFFLYLILTFATPTPTILISLAAALVKSIILPLIKGPLSLIRTTTDLLLARLVTSTLVPKGSVLCAAVILPCL